MLSGLKTKEKRNEDLFFLMLLFSTVWLLRVEENAYLQKTLKKF